MINLIFWQITDYSDDLFINQLKLFLARSENVSFNHLQLFYKILEME